MITMLNKNLKKEYFIELIFSNSQIFTKSYLYPWEKEIL